MKYFPPTVITYRTNLSKDKVLEQINKEITPPYIHTSPKRYKGEVTGNSFKLKKVLTTKTSSLPRISGTVETDGLYSIVKLEIKLLPILKIFLAVWFLGFVYTLVMAIWTVITGVMPPLQFAGFIICAPLFIWFIYKMIEANFIKEAESVNNDLKQLIEGYEQ